MKIKLIKEDRNLYKASLRTPIIYGAIEGARKSEAKFALIDNKGREFRNPIIISGKQLKEMVSTIPQGEFDELLKEGILKIVKGKIVVTSIETVEKNKLIDLGIKKDIIDTFRPTALSKLLKDIDAGMLFVIDGELVSKANKANAEREGIVQAAVAAKIIDAKILALPNEQLIAKTEEAIANNKKDAEELEVMLSKLKLLLDEAKFNEVKDAKIDVLKVVFAKAEKHYDTQFSEFKEVIKGFVDEQNLLDFVGLDKDIAKLETAKNDYNDAKDKIEKEATEVEAKKAKEDAKAKADAKKLEAKKSADKAKLEAKAKEAEKLKAKEAPGPVVLQRPKEDKK